MIGRFVDQNQMARRGPARAIRNWTRLQPRMVLAAALLMQALLLVSSHAPCADEDPRKAQAEVVFQEGLRLHDKDKEAEALEKFKKAYEMFPSPNVLYWMAREEQLLGRGLEALRHYRGALKNPLLHPGNQRRAREYVAQLEREHGRITVNGPSGATVTIDGVRVRLPMDEPLDVAPGSIVVRGERDGKRYEAVALAKPGAAISIELEEFAVPTSAGAKANPADANVAPPPPEEPASKDARLPARWIVSAGVGLVGLAALSVGVGFSFTASADADDIDKLNALTRHGQACAPGNMLPQCSDLTRKHDEKDDHEALATGFILGGAATMVAAGATFLFWPKAEASNRGAPVRPIVSPTFTGLQFQQSF